jgi:hypothetical protein
MGSVITFPIPLFQNTAIQSQFYQPSVFFISNISLGVTTTVTTTVNHNYVIGQEVRLIIPQGFGCRGLNEQTAQVIAPPNIYQLLLVEPAADGTATYSQDILASLRSTFSNITLIPGSLFFYFNFGIAGQALYQDDGNGNVNLISGTFTISSGTIDYIGGILTLNFTSSPGLGVLAKASFWFNPGSYANQVALNINSNGNDPFVAASLKTQPQIAAIGDINNGFINASGITNQTTFIQGSFINISPL